MPPRPAEPTLIAPPDADPGQNPYATGDLSALRRSADSLQAPDALGTADTTDVGDSPLDDRPVGWVDGDHSGDEANPAEALDHQAVPLEGQPACELCGAAMGAHDIFCGECGHVSGTVSRAFSAEPEAPSARVVSVTDDDDLGVTRIVPPRSAGDRFILQFSTGESVTAYGSGLVGRNPIPEPGEYFDQLVRVIDPTRSVSKTHLEFGQDAGGFWIRDRFSGNGSILREPDAAARRCDPGKRYPVVRGTRIDLGEQFLIVS